MGGACISGDTPVADLEVKKGDLQGGTARSMGKSTGRSVDAPISKRALLASTTTD